MLISLTQHTTRCGGSPGQAREDLSSAHSAVELETELVQIGLKFRASAAIGSSDQVLQVTQSDMQPVEITDGVLLRPDLHILQIQIALVAVALHNRLLLEEFRYNLLQRFVLNVGHDL